MIYRSDLQRLYSTAPVVIVLVLKEIRDRGLMMLAFFFFHANMSCCWNKILINRFEALILSFKILFSILNALILSAKSQYDGRDMFFSFIQCEWSSDTKGVTDQL